MFKGRVDKNAFSEAFKAKGIERSKDVETFLANMTGDQDGWVPPLFLFFFFLVLFFLLRSNVICIFALL